MCILSKPYFHDETAAYTHIETLLWPNGAFCPHCGSLDKVYALSGETTRIGLRKCDACRKQFTVKVGTIFESSHIPLYKWLRAIYLMCASNKGSFALQIQRSLESTYKSAWFMCQSIREAMKAGGVSRFGNSGKIVVCEESFVGSKENN